MQNKKRFIGIRGKMFIAVVVSVMLLLSLFSSVIYWKAKVIIDDGVNTELAAYKEMIAEDITTVLLLAGQDVIQIENNQYIRDFMERAPLVNDVTQAEGYRELITTLNSIRNKNENMLNMYLGIDSINRLLIHDEYELPADFDMQARPWYQAAIENGELTISEPYIDVSSNSLVITVCTPIYNNLGDLLGVAGMDITLDRISEIMGDFQYKETGHALLLNDNGQYIFNPDSNLILQESISDETQGLGSIARGLLSGATGLDSISIEGRPHLVSYAPISLSDWTVALIVPLAEAEEELNVFRILFFVATVIVFIFLSIVIYFLSGSILKQVPQLLTAFEQAKAGDLTVQATPRTQDELGQLTEGFNNMIGTQRNVIQDVTGMTHYISGIVSNTEENIIELNMNIEEISATTQQVSAGMEQTAASMEEMNATSTDIESAMQKITDKADEGNRSAKEINQRALNLKQNAIKSSKYAQEIYETTNTKLRTAIEESKAIDKIHVLSEAILEITSQTNLLALNAAIEAARAGEAGKGFAVVADEIRKLAEDSKQTVTQIQEVSSTVTTSVTHLAESSREMLDFLEQQVVQDYRMLVETGEQYSDDAKYVDTMLQEFQEISTHMLDSIQGMLNAINEVTQATHEGAEGITNIAEKASVFTSRTEDMVSQMKETRNNTEQLAVKMAQFKV
ncbi:methyl-accepting chemotaxis protein [Desulfuribacillus alkaliarsenatis]|uniref:Chemotaxis protein n=1 Tax=Desulfuribacillus alkaliarsenatis TaxID=766136 RepID=A0A1E5G3M4_9FIRM|nr:methyl-accepting chemotaxis protein [Desulfuribacillus alkaliarsenatis]OEF97689.1 hypothetical protein BHF68_14405 [Desulfuribacillus alkaliarsenatis]